MNLVEKDLKYIWPVSYTHLDVYKRQIVYKETIADSVEGVGHFEPLRHYAEVHLLMEPLPAGSGLEFDTDCSEDMLLSLIHI